jgi:hypothetical protein
VDEAFLDRLTRVKGRAIVTASRPAEVSIELDDLRHGAGELEGTLPLLLVPTPPASHRPR